MTRFNKKNEKRTFEQIREHYEVEKSLAKKLREANKNERRYLYSSIYNELFQRIPHHPQLLRKAAIQERAATIAQLVDVLKNYLHPDINFLEVGAGDCRLSLKVAELVKKVYAIDVSDEITKGSQIPQNFELLICDGCSIPVPGQSVDLIFSNQLMEHLHPDDVLEQLENIYNALKIGGVYFCITPNRLTGPSDISKYFDSVATGLHLKEYTNTEIEKLFKQVGFTTIKKYLYIRGSRLLLPLIFAKCLESLLSRLPVLLCKKVARFAPIHAMLGANVVAIK